MKKIFFFLLLVLDAGLTAQRTFVKGQKVYCWSETKLGINIYDKPDINSNKISVLPYKSEATWLNSSKDLFFSDSSQYKTLSPWAQNSTWMEIQYNGIKGFVCDLFISRLKIQSLSDLFIGTKPVKKDTVLVGNTSKFNTYYEIYTKPTGAYYKYIVIGDGCWDHIYFIPKMHLIEALMLMVETFPNDGQFCGLNLAKMEGSEYFFSTCEATTFRSIKIVKSGIIITTADCT